MKTAFSTAWKSSTQPRKQRKYAYNAPLHTRARLMHAKLSKDLQKKHDRPAACPRVGDKAKVLRGQFTGTIGKVTAVNRKTIRITVEGAHLLKSDGSKKLYPIHPSNAELIELVSDKKRFKTQTKKATTKSAQPAKKVTNNGKKSS